MALAAVAHCKSITSAAEFLCKTQPAVSAHLRQLSEAVGEPLLVRHRNGVELSEAGLRLLPFAQACVRSMEAARQTAVRLRGLEEGQLRILASTSVAVYLLPQTLAEFHRLYPRIELIVERSSASRSLKLLAGGGYNVAVIVDAPAVTSLAPENFVQHVIGLDETVLIVPPEHPLASRSVVEFAELDGLAIIERERESTTQRLVRNCAMQAGIGFSIVLTTEGTDALKEAVLQGFGCAFISRMAVQREVAGGVLKAIGLRTPPLSRQVKLICPSEGECSPAALRFVQILLQGRKTAGTPPSILG